MSIKLNLEAFDHARQLIKKKHVVSDGHEAWKEHRPSAEKEDAFIRQHGFSEYGKWYLGIDDDRDVDVKEAYKFPYGDFKNMHRCGILDIEHKAAESEYYELGVAAADLLAIIDNGEDAHQL